MLTYNNLIQLFKNISIAHKQINSFGTGEIWEIEEALKIDTVYTKLWVIPTESVTKTYTQERTFTFLVFDLTHKDLHDQEEVLSDCEQILNDIIKILRLNSDSYNVIGDPQLFPFTEEFGDWITGWRADIIIETELDSNYCDVPALSFISPETPSGGGSPFQNGLTCSELINCPVIQGLELSITTLQNEIDNLPAGFSCSDLINCATIININSTLVTLQNEIDNLPPPPSVTFNMTGEASGTGTGPNISIIATLDNDSVINKTLSNYTSGAGTVSATDSILSAIEKLDGNIQTIPTLSFSNGLTQTGNNIFWGGSLVQPTVITGGQPLDFTNNLYFYSSNSNGFGTGWLYNDYTYAGFGWYDPTNNTLECYTDSTKISLHALSNAGDNSFDAFYIQQTLTNNGTNNNFIIHDNISLKGIVYADDYSTNFTPESLISKRYATNTFQPVGNYISGSTAASNRIPFGNGTSNTITDSVNFTFTPANDRSLLVKGNAGGGFYLGAYDANFGGFWSAAITPSTSNYSLISNGVFVNINTTSTGALQICNNDNVKASMISTGDWFFGGGTSPNARLHAVSTTEQLRLGYDVSNYYSTTVATNGAVTFNAVGAGAAFNFTQPIDTASTVAKIKGSISATSGLIPFGTGAADTVSSSVDLAFNGTQFVVSSNNGDIIQAIGSGVGTRSGFLAQATDPSGQATNYMTNELGIPTSYGGQIYGGSSNGAGALFGLGRDNKYFIFADGSSNLGMAIGTLSNADVIFGSNNTERFRITATGNLGINTGVTVSAKLHVINAATSDILRLEYDSLNYSTAKISSAGKLTFGGTYLANSGFAIHNDFTNTDMFYVNYNSGAITIQPGSITSHIGYFDTDRLSRASGNTMDIISNTTAAIHGGFVFGNAAADGLFNWNGKVNLNGVNPTWETAPLNIKCNTAAAGYNYGFSGGINISTNGSSTFPMLAFTNNGSTSAFGSIVWQDTNYDGLTGSTAGNQASMFVYSQGSVGTLEIKVHNNIGTGGPSSLFYAEGNKVNIGSSAFSPVARLNVLSTTEQVRVLYDTSNYLSTTINSSGSATFSLTGTSPTFTFSQAVSARIKARVYSATTTATLTPEKDTYDLFCLTAQAGALNIANHSTTTPNDGDQIRIRILDNGTARAISYGTNYVAKAGVTLPTTTIISKNMTLGFEWDANLGKYNLMALGQES